MPSLTISPIQQHDLYIAGGPTRHKYSAINAEYKVFLVGHAFYKGQIDQMQFMYADKLRFGQHLLNILNVKDRFNCRPRKRNEYKPPKFVMDQL